MKNSRGLLTVIFFVLFCGQTIFAAPSMNGSTGLIHTPTADVLHEGQYSLGYYHFDDGGAGAFNLNVSRNLELGVAGLRYDYGNHQALFNVKYALLSETVITPGLSVGIEDIGDDRERSAYAAASKTLPLGFRIHAGVGNGRFDGYFASLEKTVNPLSIFPGVKSPPAITLIAEYDGQKMNYGTRFALLSGVNINAGWRHSEFYMGLSFTH